MTVRFLRKSTGTGEPDSLLYGQPAVDTDGNLYVGNASGDPIQVAQRGSFLVVADDTARDAIPAAYRRLGMLVSVNDSASNGNLSTLYRLEGGITNGDWAIFTSGGGATTLQEAYDGGNGILFDGTNSVDINTTASIVDSILKLRTTTPAATGVVSVPGLFRAVHGSTGAIFSGSAAAGNGAIALLENANSGSVNFVASIVNNAANGVINNAVLFVRNNNAASVVPLVSFDNKADAADIRLSLKTADPTNLNEGDFWYNSTTDVLKYLGVTTKTIATVDNITLQAAYDGSEDITLAAATPIQISTVEGGAGGVIGLQLSNSNDDSGFLQTILADGIGLALSGWGSLSQNRGIVSALNFNTNEYAHLGNEASAYSWKVGTAFGASPILMSLTDDTLTVNDSAGTLPVLEIGDALAGLVVGTTRGIQLTAEDGTKFGEFGRGDVTGGGVYVNAFTLQEIIGDIAISMGLRDTAGALTMQLHGLGFRLGNDTSDTATGRFIDIADGIGGKRFEVEGSTGDVTTIGDIKTTAGRVQQKKGIDVASANDLTLGQDGNSFSITGTTQVNAITIANWQAGSEIKLLFTGILTMKHNTAGGAGTAKIKLDGEVDMLTAAGTVLTLLYDGTDFREVTRSFTGA